MNREFSGKFVVRLSPELHAKLVQWAGEEGSSLNQACVTLLENGLGSARKGEGQFAQGTIPRYRPVVTALKRHFGHSLLGVLLFGSQVEGEATKESDVDFLIVVDRKIPLSRSLYRWWDETISSPLPRPLLNPQFVHLPENSSEGGGLWFEVALAHQILYERQGFVSSFLRRLKGSVVSGEIRRYWSHGQPYWVWEENEKSVAHH